LFWDAEGLTGAKETSEEGFDEASIAGGLVEGLSEGYEDWEPVPLTVGEVSFVVGVDDECMEEVVGCRDMEGEMVLLL